MMSRPEKKTITERPRPIRSYFIPAVSYCLLAAVKGDGVLVVIRPSPDKFYKRKSQEKHFALRRKFSDFPAPVNERGWFYKRKSQEKHFALRRKFSDFPAPVKNERGWFWSSA